MNQPPVDDSVPNPESPDLAYNIYQSLGIDSPGVTIQGDMTSVSKIRPGDLVGWHGGHEQGIYRGQLAVYAGNGEIIEMAFGQKRRRKINPDENVFGMPVNLPGDATPEI